MNFQLPIEDAVRKVIVEVVEPLQQEIESLKQILQQNGYNTEEFISVMEVAKLLGIGKSTVWSKTKEDPNFPKPVKVGRVTRWRKPEVLEYMESLAVSEKYTKQVR